MPKKKLTSGQSISGQLFKTIFGLYLILAVVVTVVQLTAEYFHVKESIISEIQKLPQTFGPGISTSLWTYNNKLLQSILKGMNEIIVVSGVEVSDSSGKRILAMGSILDSTKRRITFDKNGKAMSDKVGEEFFSSIFSHKFSISHIDFDGTVYEIGEATIFSDSNVIINRVKHGFFLILLNSVLKTLGLWMIFIFFVDKILAKPLGQLTHEVEQVSLESLGDNKIKVSVFKKNELSILKDAFNKMLEKLKAQFEIIQNSKKDLENKVMQRTAELSETTQTLKDEIDERKQFADALQRNEEKWKSLTINSPDHIMLLSLEHTIEFINFPVPGLTIDQVMGKSVFDFTPSNSHQVAIECFDKVFQTGDPSQYETKYITRDGDLQYFFVRISALLDKNRNITGFISTSSNITDQKHAEEELGKVKKMKSIGILAGGIAHEFNNLLYIISGIAELLDLDAKQEDKAYLQEITKTTKRGADLVKQLMALSRKSEINLYTIRLNIEIQRIKKMLDRTLSPLVDIKLDLADDLFNIKANQGQIEQVITNLCLNAKDAMPHGGSLTIKTENSINDKSFVDRLPEKLNNLEEGKCVILTISDTGTGMDEKTKDHIFDPFFTTKDIGKGTGLGLAVVYGIIEGHGGHITCESEPGAGAIFKTYFHATSDNNADQSPDVNSLELLPKGTETILLVDDEESILIFMEAFLKRFGYKTLSANTGEKALEIYTQERIDLVVLDIGMPGMGGQECLEKLIELDHDVKTIVASGYSNEGSVKAAGKKAKAFILKPFSGNEFIKLIRDILDE